MDLQDSYKNLNEKEIIILRDTNEMQHSERIEDCSENMYSVSILPLTVEAEIIPPNIDANKQISQQLTIKVQKSQEAKCVGINAELWEEMSVKDVTNNSLRED